MATARQTGKGSGWCSNFSVFFLVLVNLAVGIGGVALVGLGAYVLKNFGEFDELVSQNTSIYLLCSGLIIFIFSMIAIGGALTQHRKVLTVYVVVLILIIVVEVAVSVFALEYLGVIEKAGDTGSNATSISNSRERSINNFLLRAYQTCCVQNSEFCSNLPSEAEFCDPVVTCDSPGASLKEVCVDADEVGSVDQGVCTALQGFKQNGNVLVGPKLDGSCGAGDPAKFLAEFSEYLTSKLSIAGYAVLGVGILEFFVLLFSVYLIFGQKVSWERGFYGSNEEYAVAVPEALEIPGPPEELNNQRRPGYSSRALGDGFVLSVANNNTRRPASQRIVGELTINKSGENELDSLNPPGTPKMPGRDRSNSVGTNMSISKQQMQKNPDVIDDVL